MGFKYLLISLLSIIVFQGYSQKEKSLDDHVRSYIARSVEYQRVANHGLVIATISPTQIEYHYFDQNTPYIDSSSVFELGDLSQMLTSHFIHQLNLSGSLKLETVLNDVLPEIFRHPNFNKTTIQDCLSHLTGLPKVPNNFGQKQQSKNQPYANYDTDDLALFINQWKSTKQGQYLYSPLNYALLEVALNHILTDSFTSELMKSDIGQYLIFTDETIDGYTKLNDTTAAWKFKSHLAALGLRSSPHRLSQYVQDNLNKPDKVFSNALLIQGSTDIDKSISIASGWHHIKQNRNHSFYMHKGSTSGHAAFIGINTNQKLGVVIFAQTKTKLGALGSYIMNGLYNGNRRIN